MPEEKKFQKKLLSDWKKRFGWVILLTLFAWSSFAVQAAETGKEKSGRAAELEKELAKMRLATEKMLVDHLREKARLEEEIKTLRLENSLVRKELLETIDKYTMLAEKLKRWEMSAASIIETLQPVYTGGREDETAETLRTVMQSSVAMASACASLCEELDLLLKSPGVDNVHAAKVRLKVNSLRSEIRNIVRLNATPAAPEGFRSCRILATEENLNGAVFSAGYRNGLRAGMILQNKEKTIRFRIVLLKNYTSAGILLEGKISRVGIGTELFAVNKTDKK